MNHNEYTEKRNGILAKMVEANEKADTETFVSLQREIDAIDTEWEKFTQAETERQEREAAIEELRKKAKAPSRPATRPDQEQERVSKVDPRTTPEYREKFVEYLRTGDRACLRDLSVVSGPDGAYALAPASFDSELVTPSENANGLRGEIDLQVIGSTLGSNALSISARSGSFVKGDQVDLDTDTEADLTFKERKLSSWPFTMFLKVPNTWLDANIIADPMGLVMNELRLLKEDEEERLFLYGTGNSEPLGFMVDSTQGVSNAKHIETGSASGLLTFQQLVAMQYAVKPKYRQRATWGFCTDAMIQIDALRESGGAPILKQMLKTEGPVTMLFGRPIKEYQSISATATSGAFADNTLVGFYADLKQYKAIQPSIVGVRVSDQRLIEKNQTLVIVRTWLDGQPKTAEAFAIAKIVA